MGPDSQMNDPPNLSCSDHMANERTFLSWTRTSIAIIAFGFVIERFSLFIKQMSFILGKTAPGGVQMPSSGNSALLGIWLVIFGILTNVLGFLKFKKTQAQIRQGKYQSSSLLELMVTVLVLTVGIFLIFYLIGVS
jgi:uncharacterized membrane protein YidH (DUF202 family)